MRSVRRSGWAAAAVVVTLATGLAGCNGASSSSSTSGGLTSINVLEAGALPSRLPFYVALYGNIFQKHGLSVKLLEASGGAQVAQLLSGGKVQFALGQVVDELNVHNAGVPVSSIAMLTDKYENTLVVGKQYGGKINDLPDLADEPIGITAVGSGTWQFANFAASLGHVPSSKLNLVSIGSAALTSGQDLVSGRIAVTVTGDPAAVKLVGSGEGKYLLDSLDLSHGVSSKYPGFIHLSQEPFIFTWAYGTQSYISSNKKTTQEFVDALQEARNYIFSHSAGQVAQLVSKNSEFAPFGTTYLSQSVTRLRDTSKSLPTTLAIPKVNFTNAVAYASQVKSAYGSDKYSDVVDNTFANAAAKAVGTGSSAGP